MQTGRTRWTRRFCYLALLVAITTWGVNASHLARSVRPGGKLGGPVLWRP